MGNVTLERNKSERLGEINVQNCGMSCEIVEYRSGKDIDVLFEDGTLLKHRSYYNFKKGDIYNPNWIPKLNQCKRLSDGSMIKIIKIYEDEKKIDVAFDNGRISKKIGYEKFAVANLSANAHEEQRKACESERLFEIKVQNCGKEAQIIEYKNSKDISVKFIQTGVIIENRTYREFSLGRIKHPKFYIGLTRIMNNGQTCVITKVHTPTKIDVKFEDGTELFNRSAKAFDVGSIKNPNYKKYVGQALIMNNGMEATVIEQENCENMTVRFSDDTIVENVRSCAWLRGKVTNPNLRCQNSSSLQEFSIYYYLRNYGFEKITHGSKNGKMLGLENFELDFYHRKKNFAIEYDGQIHDMASCIEREKRKNKKCVELGIQLYRLRSPRLKNRCDDDSYNYILDAKKEIRNDLIDCKSEIEEILKKHNIPFKQDDIDFQRDIELILREFGEKFVNADAKERVGQRFYNKHKNRYFEIIEYINSKNVTIRYDDGEIKKQQVYQNIKKNNVLMDMGIN